MAYNERHFESFVTDSHRQNWLSVVIGLKVTADALREYVIEGLTDLHTKLYRKCATFPVCKSQCCKNTTDVRSWCITCATWKQEVLKFCRYKTHKKDIKWTSLSVSDWSKHCNDNDNNIQNLARVFVRDVHDTSNIVTNDIAAVLSIVHNCLYFDLKLENISAVRKVRNEFFAHCNFSLTRQDRDTALERLLKILIEPRLSCYQSTENAVRIVNDMKNGTMKHEAVFSTMQLDIITSSVEAENSTEKIETLINSFDTPFVKQRTLQLCGKVKNQQVHTTGFMTIFTRVFTSISFLILLFLALQLDRTPQKPTGKCQTVFCVETHR